MDIYESRSAADCLRGKQIKEAMRKSAVNNIALLISQIVQNHTNFKEQNASQIVVKALEVATGVVDWASLDLFVGNLPYLVQFLGVPALQAASAKCLYSIIDKGMDPGKKLDMFDSLGLVHILNQWDPAVATEEEDFGKSVCSANVILDRWRRQ